MAIIHNINDTDIEQGDDPEDLIECPQCHSASGEFQYVFGIQDHYKCLACGYEFVD